MNYKPILTACFLLLCIINAKAQTTGVNSLDDKLKAYGIKSHTPVLFVHFDKNVYTGNENVWLTGYLFGADYSRYNLLSLVLVKDDDRAVILENKFLVKNGLSFGKTTIPDSLAPGNYSFIATTNRLKKGLPEVVFTQPVTIKSTEAPTYSASLNPIDTGANKTMQKVMLLVNFTGTAKPPASVPGSYYVGNAANPVLRGYFSTKAGQYIFEVPSRLLSQGNNALHVPISYKGQNVELSIDLPTKEGYAPVTFYPEGGNMVNGIPGVVGFEVRNSKAVPMGATAFLYEDTKVIDTLQSNSYGLGKFTLTPKAGSNYYVRLYNQNKADTAWQLPKAVTTGPALNISHAVVNDTLAVTIRDSRKEKLYLICHNYKQLFFVQPVDMTTGIKHIKFIIKDMPKGLAQLTLTDSTGRPFAERSVFAHFDRRVPVSIATDKSEYKTREKVNVKIRLDTPLPDSGFVSVACVQESRLSINKKNDIESYFYLKNDLGNLPAKDTYMDNTETNRDFLENILLIRGWSRYKWTDVLKAGPQDTVVNYQDLAFKGRVTQASDKLNFNGPATETVPDAPVTLTALRNPAILIKTDKMGNFALSHTDLLTDSNKQAEFMAVASNPKKFRIHLSDPYSDVNELLAWKLSPINNTQSQQNTADLALPEKDHAINLKEVKIKGDHDDDGIFAALGRGQALEFGDTWLVTGVKESGSIPEGFRKDYVIIGRATYMLSLTGVNASREFYRDSQIAGVPDYQSTLYWKHLTGVSSIKNAELSFNTGDITGNFRIVVQGITTGDVTYGEAAFTVK